MLETRSGRRKEQAVFHQNGGDKKRRPKAATKNPARRRGFSKRGGVISARSPW